MTGLTIQGVQSRRKQILLALVVLIAVALLFVGSYWEEGGPVHEAIENLGLVLIFVCVLGRAWSTIYIGGRKKFHLVREGPYSISRNPLYLFSFLGVVGLGAMSGTILLGLLLLLPAYLVFRWVVAREEAHLLAAHGEAFSRYMSEVPRFLPDLRRWHDVERIEVTPRLVVRTALEACLFFIAYPVFEIVEWLQSSGYVATPVLLP